MDKATSLGLAVSSTARRIAARAEVIEAERQQSSGTHKAMVAERLQQEQVGIISPA